MAKGKSNFFDELEESIEQAVQHAEGRRRDLRTTVLPRPPKDLSSNEIKRLRSRLNVSQAVFASYLNISVKTVQSWEHGIGHPSGAALKLLSIAKKNPKILLDV